MFLAIVSLVGLVVSTAIGIGSKLDADAKAAKLESQAEEASQKQQAIANKQKEVSTKVAKANKDDARRAAGTPWILAVMKKTATKNQIKANRVALSAIDPSKGVRRHYSYGAAA
ncbi:MAG: hypothetical protein ABIE74_00610 [Pseudomonadota bacterium]